MAWPLPRALSTYIQETYRSASHPGLLLDKFTPQDLEGSSKTQWLRDVVAVFGQAGDALIAYQNQRERWAARVLEAGGQIWQGRTLSRLIVGLGGEHVLETAITLDRNTGMPIIPGSAVKGLVRTWALIEVARLFPAVDFLVLIGQGDHAVGRLQKFDEWLVSPRSFHEEADRDSLYALLEAEADETQWSGILNFQQLFGTTGRAGSIRFSDALYAGNQPPRLVIDVMTPHFNKYYTQDGIPSDDDLPIPVSYLVVDAQQPFWFGISPTVRTQTGDMDIISSLLAGGVRQLGVGAKTNQGYGVFGKLTRIERTG